MKKGALNNNWKGGRSIASNGYVLVRVGVDHHLADVRGYAYEHRVVAERKTGRRLRPGEQVHHIDGDQKNNDPDNLQVYASAALHQVEHRTRTDCRLPGEPNPSVSCACGCGATFKRYDALGRPRRYVSGHNRLPSPSQDAVLAVLGRSPRHITAIAERSGITGSRLRTVLTKLKKAGRIAHVGPALYQLPEEGGRA
ncbi:MAG: hypothetical protein SangKO_010870 [Sandaracinaceae bacterium]